MTKEEIYTKALEYLQEADYATLTMTQLVSFIEGTYHPSKNPMRKVKINDIKRLFEQFIEDALEHCYGDDNIDELLYFYEAYTKGDILDYSERDTERN